MAFEGGSADKVGNEYETWWTLRRVVQLLRGDLQAIALEPLGADGAELWVESSSGRTYDQVKFRSSGNWTPARLRSDGMLAKLGKHYAAGWAVLLVLSQPSDEFESLIGLAQSTSSGEELWRAASNSNHLDLIADAWGVGRDETRRYLTRTAVRHDGLPHLKEYVELALQLLVVGDTRLAIGILRRILDDNLNRTITAQDVWASLAASGFSARPRVAPAETTIRLNEALRRYVHAVQSSTPAGGIIKRHEVDDIIAVVESSPTPTLLVAGKAGSGKSVVVAEVAEELARSGRHVTALRLDRVQPGASTAAQLGAAIDLAGSPTVLLSELSRADSNGILLIDQLDAVSSYSGRMPHVYEAVEEALHQARLLGNVTVILAVRSIDLEEDPRLRKLAGENTTVVEVGEVDRDDVRDYLALIGTDPDSVDASTLQLLRLPIHLYVFCQLDLASRAGSYRTLSSLYAAFTASFRTRLDQAGHGDEWREVSEALVERMNADEALAVPLAVLQRVRPLYVSALISANVLVAQDGRIGVFHETYFDYMFATSFSQRGEALVQWFRETGQGLFRRSQLRQLLAYIATEERVGFARQVGTIARSDLRPHLVSIAYTALGDFTPNPADWRALRSLVTAENPFATRLVSLLSGPRWFRAADQTGDVERLLDDPHWGEVVAAKVARLSVDLPERVLELLRPRQARGDQWVSAVRSAIDVAEAHVWVEFALEQAECDGLDLPDRPFDVLQTPLFHRMIGPQPIGALRILSRTLARDIDRARSGQARDLDQVLSRRGNYLVDSGELDQLADAIAPQFVDEMLPLIEQIVGYRFADGRQLWRYRTDEKHRDFGDELYFAFGRALTRLTQADPARANPVLGQLSSLGSNATDFLVCRALHEAPADEAIDWILESEDHLSLGWLSDARWESRRLIAHASRGCSDYRFALLESALLFWTPAAEKRADALRWRGWAEITLLSALPHDRLSTAARRRLAELHRKFPQWQPIEPIGISGGTVQSPISRAAAERMTDENWLTAIAKYASREDVTFREGHAFGGVHELASLTGSLAKTNPERFINLALRFPASTAAAYTEQIIRSLAGELDQAAIMPLLRKFRADHPTESGRTVVAAIDEYATELNDELFNELLTLAGDVDPSRELAREEAGSGLYFGGDLVTAGINSTRGQAASALARVLFANSARLEAALPTIHQLATDPIVAVRTLASETALAYASIARADGLNLIENVLDDELVMTTGPAMRALRWAMLWDGDRFAPILDRALHTDDAKEAGAVWANCLVNDVLGSVSADVGSLSDSARLGVAEALSSNPGVAPEIVAELFDDPSPDVRREAASSLGQLKDLSSDAVETLTRRVLASEGFRQAAGELLDALEDLPGELPTVTWEICRQSIESMETSPPNGIGATASSLIAVLVRLYRSSDHDRREEALDLMDRTVLLHLWKVDQTLDNVR